MRSKPNLLEGMLQRTEIRAYLLAGVELLLIVAWATWVSRDMLDFDENLVPWGREYGMAVSTHHFWTMVKTCGWCALWNGSQIGGYPALVNTYAGVFHPVTMIATLLGGGSERKQGHGNRLTRCRRNGPVVGSSRASAIAASPHVVFPVGGRRRTSGGEARAWSSRASSGNGVLQLGIRRSIEARPPKG